MRGMNIKLVFNEALNNMRNKSDFPQWKEQRQYWHVEGMRGMRVYIETLEGNKIPLKWAFVQLFGHLGITSKHLSASQMEAFFNKLGFRTGSYGR